MPKLSDIVEMLAKDPLADVTADITKDMMLYGQSISHIDEEGNLVPLDPNKMFIVSKAPEMGQDQDGKYFVLDANGATVMEGETEIERLRRENKLLKEQVLELSGKLLKYEHTIKEEKRNILLD